MARVVVVGGGFGGLSAAARLAKLRHEVVLLESSERLGGRLHGHRIGDHSWQLTLDTVTLPGVLRDLFRKSGRQLDQVLDLVPTDGRRHVFADKSSLHLPFGNRADQHDVIAAFTGGTDRWSPWLDSMADGWDLLRRSMIESLDAPTRSVRRGLRAGQRLNRRIPKALKDERLEAMALDQIILDGDHPVYAPAFLAIEHYVERNFGRWRIDGGMPALAEALTSRMGERGVDVRTGTHAHDIQVTQDRVTGVVTGDAENGGVIAADLVVWCAPRVPQTMAQPSGLPVIPASRMLLRLGQDAPPLPADVLAHSDPPIQLWNSERDVWTLTHHNAEDPLIALVRVGIDLRPHVIERHDVSPVELVGMGAWGWQWQGWMTAGSRPRTGFADTLYFAGANAHPGATIERIGSATAAIAERIGKA
jgi:phytoene dehydrogenase-like protein